MKRRFLTPKNVIECEIRPGRYVNSDALTDAVALGSARVVDRSERRDVHVWDNGVIDVRLEVWGDLDDRVQETYDLLDEACYGLDAQIIVEGRQKTEDEMSYTVPD